MANRFGLLFLLAVIVASVVGATIPLWPLPSKVSVGTTTLVLNSQFNFKYSGTNGVVRQAITRYQHLLAIPATSTSGAVTSCSLTVANDSPDSDIIGSDESYNLTISETGACAISAQTTWGALRGLETFSQLCVRDVVSSESVVATRHAPLSIADEARFGHRGILIDTARHYLPLDEIRRVIDSLPTSKFNVLHWHTVDAESFPLQTPSEPTMTSAAFSPSMVYSMRDLADMRAYANARGVEIVFELDVPGHAASWTKGKPEVMADCFAKYYYNINDFALNPTLDVTYSTLQHILSDVIGATKVPRVHLGGDEVVYGCWKNDSSIVSFMDSMHWTNYDQLLGYFVGKTDKIANDLGAAVTHWEEVFTAGAVVPANTIFQVWTDSSKMSAVTAAKYPVIASPSNYWYLDIASNTWQSMYNYDPAVGLSSAQEKLIVGGETALWGEKINEVNIEQNVYPRACSVAERLWSPKTTTDNTDALDRLIIQKCRLVNRGIRSAPVQPADYCSEIYV